MPATLQAFIAIFLLGALLRSSGLLGKIHAERLAFVVFSISLPATILVSLDRVVFAPTAWKLPLAACLVTVVNHQPQAQTVTLHLSDLPTGWLCDAASMTECQATRSGQDCTLQLEVLGRGARVLWAPVPGRHVLALEDANGVAVSTAAFEVRGPHRGN